MMTTITPYCTIPKKDFIIGVLVVLLVGCLLKILHLYKTIQDDRRKRIIPFLTLEMDLQELALCLKNDSYCYAKNIRIEDLDITLRYDFKKVITLKFEPVEFLKPNERVKLQFQAFEGEHILPGEIAEKMPAHIIKSSFEVKISCVNIEGAKFSLIVAKEDHKFYIKEAKAIS